MELLVDFAGLVLLRDHAEIGADVPRVLEPVGTPADCRDEHRRADDADPVEDAGAHDHVLELRLLGEFLDHLFVGLDFQVDRLKRIHQRPGDLLQLLRPFGLVLPVEGLRRGMLDPVPDRLAESADLVDRLRPLRDKHVARVVVAQHLLEDFVAEEDGVKHLGIRDRQPSQLAGVVAVVLLVRLRDRRYLAGVGDDVLESEPPEAPVHPAAVRPGLEDDGPGAVKLRERLLKPGLRRGAGRLDNHAPFASGQFRHHADFRSAVAHVDPDCGRIFHVSPFLCCAVWFLHLLADECVYYD